MSEERLDFIFLIVYTIIFEIHKNIQLYTDSYVYPSGQNDVVSTLNKR